MLGGGVARLARGDGQVGALAQPAHKELHAEDRKEAQKEEQYAEDLADFWHGREERLDDATHVLITLEQLKRTQHPQNTQVVEHLKLRILMIEEDDKVDAHNDQIHPVPPAPHACLEHGTSAPVARALG